MKAAPLCITEITRTPNHSSIQMNRIMSSCTPNQHFPQKRQNMVSYTVLRTQNPYKDNISTRRTTDKYICK